ncbi:MAG: NUDIX domain-containing protein [Proteobacteria bacterium]|nr:NUDIX domain-containing protein [Pseudomonadota bacterium]
MTVLDKPPRIRRAARILLLDPAARVLLFRFTPDDRPPLWATPGGECDEGEDFCAAARRELMEETGIDCDPGPAIARRSSRFRTFAGEDVVADERYFWVNTQACSIETSGHTATERAVMKEHRWFALAEIDNWHEPIYPENLADLLRKGMTP